MPPVAGVPHGIDTRDTFGYAGQRSDPAVDTCHVTVTGGDAAPAPNGTLDPVTVYVCGPALRLVVVQVLPVALMLQPGDHAYDDGDWLQLAVKVSGWPVNAVVVLGVTVHDGAAVGAACQLTTTLAGAPVPDALLAVSV